MMHKGHADISEGHTEGWHKFDIRVADNSASDATTTGSGGKLTDSHGNVCALYFQVNGGATESFDERYLPIAYSAGDAQKHEVPGLGGEIELAAGSILTNDVRTGGWCPIYGTLKGTGTLSGPFRFSGDDNCWEVTDARANNDTLPCINFSDATSDTFAGLKTISVLFDAKPSRRDYYLTNAIDGLTAADLPAATLMVKDADDRDYSANFTLTVKNGRLALSNSKPGGTYIIVR